MSLATQLQSAESALLQHVHDATALVRSVGQSLPLAMEELRHAGLMAKRRLADYAASLADVLGEVAEFAEGLAATLAEELAVEPTAPPAPAPEHAGEAGPAEEGAIADHCRVDGKTVAAVRATAEVPQSDSRTGRDGRTIDTGNPPPAPEVPRPEVAAALAANGRRKAKKGGAS